MKTRRIFGVCVIASTLMFAVLNGGEDAPMGIQALTLAGIIASLFLLASGNENTASRQRP